MAWHPTWRGTEQKWLHGQLEQNTAKALLGDAGSKPDGSFLVWERQPPTEYGLGVVFKGKPTMHLMKQDPDTKVSSDPGLFGACY